MKKIDIICPCCNKNVQIILSDKDIGTVTDVLINKENDSHIQKELEKELFDKNNIILG